MSSRRDSRRASLVESYRHGSISATEKTAGGALEAVTLVLPKKEEATFETEAELEEYYKPIPSYEGYHRYDPQYRWSPDDEKRIVRKVWLYPSNGRFEFD